MPEPLELRVLRIEGVLGLRPDLRFVSGSEWWIVQAGGTRGDRTLNYWGPFPSAELAQESESFRPALGCVIVEVPV